MIHHRPPSVFIIPALAGIRDAVATAINPFPGADRVPAFAAAATTHPAIADSKIDRPALPGPFRRGGAEQSQKAASPLTGSAE